MFYNNILFLQRTISSRDKGPNLGSQYAAPLLSFYFLFLQKTGTLCFVRRTAQGRTGALAGTVC